MAKAPARDNPTWVKWYENNKERIIEAQRVRHQTDEEYRKRRNEDSKRAYQKNIEVRREKARLKYTPKKKVRDEDV